MAVNKRHPALGKAGHTLTLRLVFQNGRTGHKFSFDLPRKAAKSEAQIYVSAGYNYPFERSAPHTIEGIEKLVDNMTRNDQAKVALYGYGKHGFRRTTVTPAEGTVIHGRGSFWLVIK